MNRAINDTDDMTDIAFPVYVLCEDSKEVIAFPTFPAMQSYLEAVDVESEEYGAYDSNGSFLFLRTGQPKAAWLKLSKMQAQLSASEFSVLKARAKPFEKPGGLLMTVWRKLNWQKAKS